MRHQKRQFLQMYYDIFKLIGEYTINQEKIKIDYLNCLIIERIFDFQRDGMPCYITNEQLAKIFNSSVRTIARHISNLIKLKIIISNVSKTSNNGQKSNVRVMIINRPAMAACLKSFNLDEYYGNE